MDTNGVVNGTQAVHALGQAHLVELRARNEHGSGEAGGAVEKLFASMLVKELRRGLDQGFFNGPGSQVYTAWLDEHLGQALADRDALGLAGMVKVHMDRQLEAEEAQA